MTKQEKITKIVDRIQNEGRVRLSLPDLTAMAAILNQELSDDDCKPAEIKTADMTLRDWFAVAAAASGDIAMCAYETADAMLDRRNA